MTDFPDWQDPTAIANEISLTGVPLLNLSSQLGSGVIASLGVGSTSPVGPFSANQISYELYVGCQAATAPVNANTLDVAITWTDSVSGITLATKSYRMVAGPNGTDHTVKFNGPAHADRISVTFTGSTGNQNPVQVTWRLLGSSRIYRRDIVRTIVYAQQGFQGGGPLPANGVLSQQQTNIAAAGNAQRLLPAYTGRVFITGTTNAASATLRIQLVESTLVNPLMSLDPIFFDQVTDAHGGFSGYANLPGVQAIVKLINNDVALQTCFCVVTIDDSEE